jgi:hypothetical protein
MDFYAKKSRDLPRFIYRRLNEVVGESAGEAGRTAVIADFCGFVENLKPVDDWQKMKWCLPASQPPSQPTSRTKFALSDGERAQLEATLQQKRRRRNDKLIEVYPHCSDEFSLDTAFLDAAFGSERHELIGRSTRIFTIGSCFAHNIARYLKQQGYNVTPYAQAEDLNSPFSNARMLSLCAAPAGVRKDYIDHWVRVLYPAGEHPDLDAVIAGELAKLDALTESMRESEFLIVTCGNVLDYFMQHASGPAAPGPDVAPKFLSISNSEDIAVRGQLTAKLKQAGAEFRLGSYAEVAAALDSLCSAIRAINPDAYLLLTLSPIPIDSAIGIQHSAKMGAVEIDCVSKSLLRVALNDLFEQRRDDKKLLYFPSFEIVRWVAPCMDGAVFGAEDAASRHVSQNILAGVYDYFLRKFGKAEEIAAA